MFFEFQINGVAHEWNTAAVDVSTNNILKYLFSRALSDPIFLLLSVSGEQSTLDNG